VTTARTSRLRRAIFAFGLALPFAAPAETPSGSLAGVVIDAATASPVAGAVVTARSPALIGEQGAVTDADGAFELTLLPAGTYSVSVQGEGFEPFVHAGLIVKGGIVRVRIAVVPVPTPGSVAGNAVEFDESMTAPTMISGPAPEYTPEAIERGIEGTMQIRCVVTVEGAVRGCKVLKGLPFMNLAVIEALHKRKYRPALSRGKPVDVFYTFNIRLKLPAQ